MVIVLTFLTFLFFAILEVSIKKIRFRKKTRSLQAEAEQL